MYVYLVNEWEHTAGHYGSLTPPCLGICRSMAHDMPRHSYGYAEACLGICLGVPRNMPDQV